MCNKEEPHTNIKDLPKQLAKLNVCIDNSLLCYYVYIIKVAYFDSVDIPSKDSFHTIGQMASYSFSLTSER